jgi:uncharacterized protein YgiM (DUF1202 family)
MSKLPKTSKPFYGILISIVALSFGAASAFADPEYVYVNPAKAQLRSEPKMNATVLNELPRGTKLKVSRKEGLWLQVSIEGKANASVKNAQSGWMSKLFLSPNAPVGEAELGNLANDNNLSKASRRRSSSYNVSASTRGLTAGNRGREGREKFQSDAEAVEKMDKAKPVEGEVRNFKKDGKLPE